MTEENDSNIQEQIRTFERMLKMAQLIENQHNKEDQVDIEE